MSVATVVAGLCALDIHDLDRDGTVAALARSAGVRRWLDGIDVALTARLVELSGTTTPSLFPEQAVAEATRTGTREGNKLVERAKTVAAIPEIGAALDTGDIAGAHVDVITAALTNLEPTQQATLTAAGPELAVLAATSTPDQFRRTVAARVRQIEADDGIARLARQKRQVRLRSWVDRETGMIRIAGEFDPETGLNLLGAITNQVEAMIHAGVVPEGCPPDPLARQQFLQAHALLKLIEGTGPCAGRPTVIITIDHQTVAHGRHTRTRFDCGHEDIDLPVDSVRRLLEFADIIPVIIDDDGVALKLGHTARFANRAQRRAIRAMYRTCAVPGCRVHVAKTEPHHIFHVTNGGTTDIEHLVPLCKHHHDMLHAKHWTVTTTPSRSFTFQFPDGTTMTTGPPAEQWNGPDDQPSGPRMPDPMIDPDDRSRGR